MDASPRSTGLRLSLRELLLVVVAAALGCGALRFANGWWAAATTAVLLLVCLAAAIVALVGRGPGQAFAIGFSVAAVGYGVVVISHRYTVESGSRNNELYPGAGLLLTSRLLAFVHEAVAEPLYRHPDTGEIVGRGQLPPDAVVSDGSAWPQTNRPVFMNAGSLPDGQDFMRVGHCLWGLVLGYVGGHFGRFVYARRRSSPSKQ